MFDIFGFDGGKDLYNTLVRHINLPVLAISALFSSIVEAIEYVTGMDAVFVVIFVSVFIIDFIMGIAAAKKLGQFTSKRMLRVLLKVFVYMMFLTIINLISYFQGTISDNINIYTGIYYFAMNVIILSQIKSINESMIKIFGTKELKAIYRKIDKTIDENLNNED